LKNTNSRRFQGDESELRGYRALLSLFPSSYRSPWFYPKDMDRFFSMIIGQFLIMIFEAISGSSPNGPALSRKEIDYLVRKVKKTAKKGNTDPENAGGIF